MNSQWKLTSASKSRSDKTFSSHPTPWFKFGSSFRDQRSPRYRRIGFEPLEQRRLLSANPTLDEATPENVDASFRALGGNQGEQVVVYGSLHAIGNSFESGQPGDGWDWNDMGEEVAPVFTSTEWGSVDGDAALMMHGPMWGASWRVDVSAIENPLLSFWHASWEGAGQSLHWHDHQSTNQDDGVVIEGIVGQTVGKDGNLVDISTPLRVWVPPDQKSGEWVHYTIDLAALAEEYGDPLTPTYVFHFQQVDWYEIPGSYIGNRLLPEAGRGWDAVLLTSADPIGDWYEFTLEDGQSASLAMAAEGLPAETVLEVYDTAGNRLAFGDVQGNNVVAIHDFRDLTTDGTPQTYRVRAGAVVTTPDWDYSLVITRNEAANVDTSPFEVVGVTQGTEPVGTVPTLDVTFNDALQIDSLDVADFTVDGLPVESVRLIYPDTVRVQPRTLSPGAWNVEIAAGAVQDLQATAVQGFSGGLAVGIEDALLGDSMHETVLLGELEASGAADPWTVQLGAGQTITLTLEGEGALAPTVRLLGPDSSELAVKMGEAGAAVVLKHDAAVAGTYQIVVGGTGGSFGRYEGKLVIGAVVEQETTIGTANDTAASAEDLDGAFTDLVGSGGEAAAVRGELPTSAALCASEKFDKIPGSYDNDYTVDYLGAMWRASTTRRDHALPRFQAVYDDGRFVDGYMGFPGAAEDDHVDASVPYYYDATWTVDLSEVTDNATLSFDFRVQGTNNVFTPFSGTFTDKTNATGIAISADGVTWYPVWNAPEQAAGVWVNHTVDLMAAVSAAGISLDSATRIRFQNYAVSKQEGRFADPIDFDDLAISSKPPAMDWYRFSLADGQTASLIADAGSSLRIKVFDAQMRAVAEGVKGTGPRQAIDRITDTTTDGQPGIYYLRVTGAGGPYSLVVARDVAAGWAQGVATAEYVVGARLADQVIPSKIQIDPVAPNADYGDYEEPTDSETDPPGEDDPPTEFELGEVDQATMFVHPNGGILTFHLIPVNTACLTAIGSTESGTLSLTLEDPNTGQAVNSVVVDGNQRVELQVDAGQEYILYVAGTSTDARVELLNLVTIPPIDDDTTVTTPDPAPEDNPGSEGAHDGYGRADAPIEFGTAVSETNLGVVDDRELSGLNLSGGTLAYRLTPARDGFMTAIGTAGSGTLYLELEDRQTGDVLYSVQVDGNQRVDMSVDSDHEHILYVTGTSTGASLRLLNLVSRHDTTLTVYDTEGDDQFVFDAGSGIEVSINGVVYPVSDSADLEVAFGGGTGSDTATLIGSSGDEEVKLYPDSGQMMGAGWTISVDQVSSIEVVGGGGIDTASLYDSPGDDHLECGPGSSKLTGPGFEHVVTDFSFVHAYGKSGGTDSAVINGPEEGRVKFKADASEQWSKMYGAQFFARTKFFELVEAYHHGEQGLARFFDGEGDDNFVGGMDLSQMSGPDYRVTAHGFTQVIASAKSGGNNAAQLLDTAGNDEVRFRVHKTQIYDSDTEGQLYRLTVRAFDSVHASSSMGGYDKAKLHDGSQDDVFEAAESTARLKTRKGNGVEVLSEAIGFDFVKVCSSEGNDQANEGDLIDFELLYDGNWD